MVLLTHNGYQYSGGQQPAMVVIDTCPECQSNRYKKNGSATQVMLATRFRATVGQKHRPTEGGRQQPCSLETRAQGVDRHSSRKTAIFTAASRIIHIPSDLVVKS